MGSAVNKVVKEAKRVGDRVGREVGRATDRIKDEATRSVERAVNEVGRVGSSVGKEVSRSVDKTAREFSRFEKSDIGRGILNMSTLGVYGAASTAAQGGNSLDWGNVLGDWMSSGVTNFMDAAGEDVGDIGRTVTNVGVAAAGAIAAPFTGGASLAVSSVAMGAEGTRQLGKMKQTQKAEARELSQEQARYEARQKRLSEQANFINSIYAQGSQNIQANAFYNTYNKYGRRSQANVATYGWF